MGEGLGEKGYMGTTVTITFLKSLFYVRLSLEQVFQTWLENIGLLVFWFLLLFFKINV